MAFSLIILALGLILSLSHLFGEIFGKTLEKKRGILSSFTVGLTITLLFLELFPQALSNEVIFGRISLIFILIGFTVYHILEKHAYKHIDSNLLRTEIKEYHAIAIFLYHFLIGLILAEIAVVNFSIGILFTIPVLFHVALSSISYKDVEESMKENFIIKILLVSSSFLGTLISILISIPTIYFHSFLGLVVGIMFYVVVRDSIPAKKEGKPTYFLLGVLLSALIILIKWLLV